MEMHYYKSAKGSKAIIYRAARGRYIMMALYEDSAVTFECKSIGHAEQIMSAVEHEWREQPIITEEENLRAMGIIS